MKMIQPNCRAQFAAEDIEFILSVLGSLFLAFIHSRKMQGGNPRVEAVPRDTLKDLGKKVFLTVCYTCHKDSVRRLIDFCFFTP